MSFQTEPIPYLPVFVYGTLRPGQANYPLLHGFTVSEEPASVAHMDLFALPFYPMALSGTGTLIGDLLFLAPTTYRRLLQRLDDLEGWFPGRPNCPFKRIQCQVTTQTRPQQLAWMYIGNRAYLGAESVQIDHGDWVRYRSQRAADERVSLQSLDVSTSPMPTR